MEIETGYGLHKRATFQELISYIEEDPDVIKYPNRMAIWAGDNPFLTQMDADWLDETVGPRHAHMQHQLWLATQKASNPSAIYDPETGTTAAIGYAVPFDPELAAIEDLTERSLAATTSVRPTEPGTNVTTPGILPPDA